jgi:hypothetical protein
LPYLIAAAKIQKKEDHCLLFPTIIPLRSDYFLPRLSSETVSFLRPFALRAASTLRPFAVDILSRKPCLCLRLVFEGWYVLFISLLFFILEFFGRQKYTFFLSTDYYGKIFFRWISGVSVATIWGCGTPVTLGFP